jgi:hypothetical protein
MRSCRHHEVGGKFASQAFDVTAGDAPNTVFERSPDAVHGQEHGGKSVNYLTQAAWRIESNFPRR